MIKAVFMDIDNTILDFDAYVKDAMRTGFEKFALKKYEEWMFDEFLRINTGLWKQIEDGVITFEKLKKIRWNLIFKELGIDFDGVVFEDYFRRFLFDSAIPIDGAEETLKYLSEKYIVCAASNGPYKQQANRIKTSGLGEYFTELFISEAVGAQKPSKLFFDFGIKILNNNSNNEIKPYEIIMIGDSLTSDMKGGIDSGMKVCWFNRKKQPTPDNLKLDYIVKSLEEIKDIL
ncbi:MAG: YjjG family noncanonical pyrimidine nucleotidase [Ruminococcus sp.]|nr:YjjG family noncanonical pyrimidine nucleotidase [Ruminococcus sp.]